MQFGHRFDEQNHEWLYLQDFLSMSYSYMTLVILSKQQDLESFQHEDYLFDLDKYNFVIKKRTALSLPLDGQEITNDHEHLRYVLEHFEKTD